MQIIENKRAIFFNNGTADVVAPGIAAVIAAARHVIMRQLFIVLIQNILVDRLVVVFMDQHRRRQARLEIRVVSRPAEAETEQGQDVLRQLQQFGYAFNIVTQPADIHAA